jgi:hypothetical protein
MASAARLLCVAARRSVWSLPPPPTIRRHLSHTAAPPPRPPPVPPSRPPGPPTDPAAPEAAVHPAPSPAAHGRDAPEPMRLDRRVLPISISSMIMGTAVGVLVPILPDFVRSLGMSNTEMGARRCASAAVVAAAPPASLRFPFANTRACLFCMRPTRSRSLDSRALSRRHRDRHHWRGAHAGDTSRPTGDRAGPVGAHATPSSRAGQRPTGGPRGQVWQASPGALSARLPLPCRAAGHAACAAAVRGPLLHWSLHHGLRILALVLRTVGLPCHHRRQLRRADVGSAPLSGELRAARAVCVCSRGRARAV